MFLPPWPRCSGWPTSGKPEASADASRVRGLRARHLTVSLNDFFKLEIFSLRLADRFPAGLPYHPKPINGGKQSILERVEKKTKFESEPLLWRSNDSTPEKFAQRENLKIGHRGIIFSHREPAVRTKPTVSLLGIETINAHRDGVLGPDSKINFFRPRIRQNLRCDFPHPRNQYQNQSYAH